MITRQNGVEDQSLRNPKMENGDHLITLNYADFAEVDTKNMPAYAARRTKLFQGTCL